MSKRPGDALYGPDGKYLKAEGVPAPGSSYSGNLYSSNYVGSNPSLGVNYAASADPTYNEAYFANLNNNNYQYNAANAAGAAAATSPNPSVLPHGSYAGYGNMANVNAYYGIPAMANAGYQSYNPNMYNNNMVNNLVMEAQRRAMDRVEAVKKTGKSDGKISADPSTRSSRKCYVGGLTPDVTDTILRDFFNTGLMRVLPHRDSGDSIVNVFVDPNKKYSFVEFRSLEECTYALKFDGSVILNNCCLRIRRPQDYNPALAAQQLQLELRGRSNKSQLMNAIAPASLGYGSVDGITTTVEDGPNKIFIGGIPHTLSDRDIKSILTTFGPLKALHIVKNNGETCSKGYAFCEWLDSSIVDSALFALHGLQIGDRTLTVRRANLNPRAGQSSGPKNTNTSFGPMPNPLTIDYAGGQSSTGVPSVVPSNVEHKAVAKNGEDDGEKGDHAEGHDDEHHDNDDNIAIDDEHDGEHDRDDDMAGDHEDGSHGDDNDAEGDYGSNVNSDGNE